MIIFEYPKKFVNRTFGKKSHEKGSRLCGEHIMRIRTAAVVDRLCRVIGFIQSIFHCYLESFHPHLPKISSANRYFGIIFDQNRLFVEPLPKKLPKKLKKGSVSCIFRLKMRKEVV